MEASTTKVSSKGQVVIPISVRKAARIKEGERLLAIAIDDTIILKKIVDKTFEETVKPIWTRMRQMGLTEEDVDAIIREAKT
jgi:antitoxin PrlF